MEKKRVRNNLTNDAFRSVQSKLQNMNSQGRDKIKTESSGNQEEQNSSSSFSGSTPSSSFLMMNGNLEQSEDSANASNSKSSKYIIQQAESRINRLQIGTTGEPRVHSQQMITAVSSNWDLLKISNYSFFAERNDLFQRIAPHICFQTFSNGEFIFKENEIVDHVYWILEGNCIVSRTLQFLSPIIKPEVLIPYQANAPIPENHILSAVEIDTQDIGEGAYMPSLLRLESSDGSRNYATKVQDAVRCEGSVLVAKLPLLTFIDKIPESVFGNFKIHPDIYQFENSFLQEEFLEELRYQELLKKHEGHFEGEASLVLDPS
jgi:hypothetical protein